MPDSKRQEIKLEYLFLIFAIVFGVFTTFLVPPMISPDENTHFYNSYTDSRGQFFREVVDGRSGKYMPQGIIDFVEDGGGNYKNENYSYWKFYFSGALPTSEQSREEVFKEYFSSSSNPICYAVPAIGMAVGNLLLPLLDSDYVLPYNLLLFGKLFNLAFYVIVVFFALKMTPCFKRTMFMLSLMPMSIAQAASLSYDVPLIAFCFLLFAYTMRILADVDYRITWRDIVVIAVIAVFLCGIKQAYAPMMLILFAIPRSRFGSWKRYFFAIGIVVAAGAVAYLAPSLINSAIYSAPADPNKVLQQEYLMNHLWEFPVIILRTMYHQRTFYMEGFFGKLGQQDVNFPPTFIILFYLLLAVVIFYDACEAKFVRYPVKLLAAAGCLIMMLGSYYAMYVGWTSLPEIGGIGVNYVTGIQGRYFIPISIFIAMLFSNRFIKKPLKGSVALERSVSVAMPVFLGIMLFLLLIRYWI